MAVPRSALGIAGRDHHLGGLRTAVAEGNPKPFAEMQLLVQCTTPKT